MTEQALIRLPLPVHILSGGRSPSPRKSRPNGAWGELQGITEVRQERPQRCHPDSPRFTGQRSGVEMTPFSRGNRGAAYLPHLRTEETARLIGGIDDIRVSWIRDVHPLAVQLVGELQHLGRIPPYLKLPSRPLQRHR